MLKVIGFDLLAVALVLLVRQTLWMPVRVKGTSMLSSLKNGELLWVSRLRLRRKGVQRGDVVICHFPGRTWKKCKFVKLYFVKRVIGLPGETIAIDEGVVYINGEPIDEPYLDPARSCFRRHMEERVLGMDEVFVMGDNRDFSHDSRRIGPIPAQLLVGVVVRVLWPWHDRRRPAGLPD